MFTPESLDAGDTFRLLFATSTTRSADAVLMSVYNTFVRDAAKGGHGQIPASCGNKFNAIISTQYDSARFNTRTRSTDTDAPIWWVKGDKVADNYADFYDGSWDSRSAKNEYGTTPINEQRVWTGSLSNGHHPGTGYAGHFGVEVHRGHLKTGDPLNAGSTNSGAKYRLYGLSPIFTVVKDPRLSLSLAKTSANEGNSGVSHVVVKAKLDKRRSTDTSFKLCVKNTSTATFRTSTSTNDRDFDLYDYPWNAQLTTNASNCHAMTIKTNFKERAVRLFIYGDTTKEENETVVLELKDPPSGVKIASSGRTATYTITNDDSEPTVTITGGATASEGTNATFTVKSSHAPKNALSVKVNITEDEDADTGKDHVDAADEGVRTVTVAAGSTSQSFTVPTSEDWVDEPDGVITATVQAGTGYVVGQANKSAQVNVQDDDTRGFVFQPAKLKLKEGGSATYTVALTSRPLDEPEGVTVTLTPTGDLTVDTDSQQGRQPDDAALRRRGREPLAVRTDGEGHCERGRGTAPTTPNITPRRVRRLRPTPRRITARPGHRGDRHRQRRPAPGGRADRAQRHRRGQCDLHREARDAAVRPGPSRSPRRTRTSPSAPRASATTTMTFTRPGAGTRCGP